MVGSALIRRLQSERCGALLIARREEVDLRDQAAVGRWMRDNRPQTVFLPAAKVGGILANSTCPADFIYENLMIAANVINAAYEVQVEKLLFLGSSCIYPRLAPQPITEDALMTGALEPTNEWYAVAKIAGVKLCEAYRRQHGCDFVSAMPTNLYGPGDNFHPENSHVIPGMLQRAHKAKLAGRSDFEIWGTGAPYREFMHVDDCADALVHIMKHYSDLRLINVGVGSDVTIETLARLVMKTVGLTGDLRKDLSKPDGAPRKLLSIEKLKTLGWSPKTSLSEGLARTYDWFVANVA
jgi:GDP-L-fucose synthase